MTGVITAVRSFQGEFKPVGNPRATLAQFVPAPLPSLAEMDKMVYIWLTDYVFNTASFVYHQQRALRTVITPNDVRETLIRIGN